MDWFPVKQCFAGGVRSLVEEKAIPAATVVYMVVLHPKDIAVPADPQEPQTLGLHA